MYEEKNDAFDTRQINILIAKRRSEKRRRRIISLILACTFGIGIAGAFFSVYLESRVERDADLSIYQAAKSENVTRFFYFDEKGNAVEIEGSAVYSARSEGAHV